MAQNPFLALFVLFSLAIKLNGSPISTTIEYDSRVQKIKEDILSKLGLDDIPSNTISKDNLPSALLSDPFYKLEPRSHENETTDGEMVVIKKKMIVIGQVASIKRCGTKQCMLVEFNEEIPTDLEVLSAELWVYKKPSASPKTSFFSFYSKHNNERHLIHYSSSRHSAQPGWMTMEQKQNTILKITKDGKKYLKFQTEMICENCYFSNNAKEHPFIALKTIKKLKERKRRGTSQCSNNDSCCRKSLKIDFKQIGWDNWIISPKSYNAHYCHGDCSGKDTLNYKHTDVIKAVAIKTNRKDISSCCTPKRFSSLSMLYMSDENIIRREIENMVVEECWCV